MIYEWGLFKTCMTISFLGNITKIYIGFPIVIVYIGISAQNVRWPHFQNWISRFLVNECQKFWYLEKAENLFFQKSIGFAWFWNSETRYISTWKKCKKRNSYAGFDLNLIHISSAIRSKSATYQWFLCHQEDLTSIYSFPSTLPSKLFTLALSQNPAWVPLSSISITLLLYVWS